MKMFNDFMEFQRQGSDWKLQVVQQFKIHVVKYKPLKGSSYITILVGLRGRTAIVNVKNQDKKCFLWTVVSALYRSKTHVDRWSKYKHIQQWLDMSGFTYPFKPSDIPRFEAKNHISLNLFGYRKKKRFAIHITDRRWDKHINSLYLK